MNPGLLARLFAAQQEPQWGPNPYARQYGGRDDVPAPQRPPIANNLRLEQVPSDLWGQRGPDIWDERAPQAPASYDDRPDATQEAPTQGPEAPISIDDLINLPSEPRPMPPPWDDSQFMLDRVEDNNMGVVQSDADGGTFDYNADALPPGTQPGDDIPADYFGPWHGPTQVIESPPPEQQPPVGAGPQISGAPLAEMFGPPVPPSLPRMTSR